MDLHVRDVTLADVPAIGEAHRGSEGPWIDPVECAIFVNHRLLRPYLCRVAEHDGDVVGHAEWNVGHQPDQNAPYLYLGMLQVRADCQRQGVGRRLLDDGADLARQAGCDRLRTIPEDDVEGFYHRCGWQTVGHAASHRLPVTPAPLPPGWRRERTVPARVVREQTMYLGWVQACPAHMWEICNRPAVIAGDETWYHPCAVGPGRQAHVQLRYRDASQALVLAWSASAANVGELLLVARHLAARRGVTQLLLALHPETALPSRVTAEPAGTIAVLERPL